MSGSLHNRALAALAWSFAERFSQQGIQFVITIVLARLLLPEEFGLIAMLTIFIAVARSFVDSGFGQALIQNRKIDRVDESSVFYFNVLVSAFAAVVVCLAAPAIATFYDNPQLIPLARVLSLNIVIGAFGVVHAALLTRQIDFKTQLKVSLIATVISGAIGIGMACQGCGAWSLVGQSITGTTLRVLFLWILHEWRPTVVFSFSSLRSMFPFGSRLLVSSLLDTIFDNMYVIVIGRLFLARDLGFFTRARSLQQFPAGNVTNVVTRVMFPVLSQVSDDKDRLKRAMRRACSLLAMVIFPAMIGLAVVARPLVVVLLTEKWLPCVPYLQLLCFVGILYPLHSIHLNGLKAQGRSDLFLRLEILKKIIGVLAIAITWRWGIVAMIYGQIATSCICYSLNSYYTVKLLDYGFSEQLRDLAPSFVVAILMGLSVSAMQSLPFACDLTLLAAQTSAGVILYAAMSHIGGVAGFRDALDLLKPVLILPRPAKQLHRKSWRDLLKQDLNSDLAVSDIPFQEFSDSEALTAKPLVSVHMLTYNHAPYISQAIEGVLCQATDFPIELVIGEDCSNDGTCEIVMEYQKRYPDRIRVITSDTNVGASKNGLRTEMACRGKYVAYCEGDDFWHNRDKLQIQADFMEGHPECVLTHSAVYVWHEATGKRTLPFSEEALSRPRTTQNLYLERMTAKMHVYTCSACVRRATLEEILRDCPECWDPQYPMGDTQRWFELGIRGSATFLPDVLATRRVLLESASNSRSPARRLEFVLGGKRLRYHYFKKYPLPAESEFAVRKGLQTWVVNEAFQARRFDIVESEYSSAKESQSLQFRTRIAYWSRKSRVRYFFGKLVFRADEMVRRIVRKTKSLVCGTLCYRPSRLRPQRAGNVKTSAHQVSALLAWPVSSGHR